MAVMFFGAYFREFSDKYGINWMINYQNKIQHYGKSNFIDVPIA